jgi:hypothetical protein
VKKGEHGSFLFSQFFQFALPAYPTENVLDPTGARGLLRGRLHGLPERGREDLGVEPQEGDGARHL